MSLGNSLRRVWSALSFAILASVVLVACMDVEPPEGRLVCGSSAECPSDWVCRADSRCYRTADVDASTPDAGFDAGRDAGPRDAGPDATTPIDAGSDDAEVDAMTLEDAGPDDAGEDAATPVDAGTDAGFDGGFDLGFDLGVDAGTPDACTPRTFYQDNDTDGYGAPGFTVSGCVQPIGYVAVSGDCDDGDITDYAGVSSCIGMTSRHVCNADGLGYTASTCAAGQSCSAGTCAVRCGDGILAAGEVCDDGNLINGDGCSSLCRPDWCGCLDTTSESVTAGVAAADLQLQYGFNGNVTDLSGHGHDGVVTGTARYGAACGSSYSDFDGTFSVTATAATGPTTTASRTISFWVQPAAARAEAIAHQYDNGLAANSSFFLYWAASGGIFVGANGTDTLVWNPNSGPATGWHHVVVVFASGTDATKIYMDGALRVTGTLTYSVAASSRPFQIGSNMPSGGLGARGGLDDFRVYNRALTGSEIAALAHSTTRPLTCPSETPSCSSTGAGLSTCGPDSAENCCVSPLVSGGPFYRSYDGVTAGYTSMAYPATVSDFRLDKYEVTVGRFRQFVAAVAAGWRPTAGAGKHRHLNGGSGLANSGSAGGFEPGWDAAWTVSLPTTPAAWTTALSCNATYQTWTNAASTNEGKGLSTRFDGFTTWAHV